MVVLKLLYIRQDETKEGREEEAQKVRRNEREKNNKSVGSWDKRFPYRWTWGISLLDPHFTEAIIRGVSL